MLFKIDIPQSFRLFFISCCCFILSVKCSVAADSTIMKTELVESVIEPAANNNKVYTDSDYFKNIPVEQATHIDDSVSKSTFTNIQGKYNSDEFNYEDNTINRLSWWKRLSRRVSEFINSLIPDFNLNLGHITYYILVGIGLIALIYIIYRLAISGKGLKFKEEKEEGEIAPEWMEKKLTELDLQTFLRQALAENNYMLAIRYLHLINLKKLAAKGQIEWDYKKTNHEFLREIKNRDLSSDFSLTIRIYEYIWYGKFAVDENKFKKYKRLFNSLNQKIA